MSSNIPVILVGGAALAAGVYFLTKREDPVVAARERREADIARGGPKLVSAGMDDPPLQGAAVAETCKIERRGDWSKENPRFILACEGATFTTFDHKRKFAAPANHANYGSDRCGGQQCALYQPGPNPNAKYPSDFVETSKGIAAILGTVGSAATNIFQSQAQFDLQKQQLKTGGYSQQPQIIQAPAQSNTALIAVVLLGGLVLAGMMYTMNKKDTE